MSELSNVMAKLAGVRLAIIDLMNEEFNRRVPDKHLRTRSEFHPDLILHYFVLTSDLVDHLKRLLPDLYGDFQSIQTTPGVKMADESMHFGRTQAAALVRAIDQIFEIRANSELPQPAQQATVSRVFISHGRSLDWQKVQPFLERDVKLKSLELAQEPSLGKTVIEKLEANAAQCDSAVIVMTGDDLTKGDEARVRENVMHEIGFFQARYGRQAVILLHEEGVNIPSNLGGVVYIPFPKGTIEASFHVLQRELKALYHLT